MNDGGSAGIRGNFFLGLLESCGPNNPPTSRFYAHTSSHSWSKAIEVLRRAPVETSESGGRGWEPDDRQVWVRRPRVERC